MAKKSFDCVEMKRRGAAWVAEQLAGRTHDEQRAWWAARSAELFAEWNAARQASPPAEPTPTPRTQES